MYFLPSREETFLPSLSEEGKPPSPSRKGVPPVSLRLGHARGLTIIQIVIQDPRAASLPVSGRGTTKWWRGRWRRARTNYFSTNFPPRTELILHCRDRRPRRSAFLHVLPLAHNLHFPSQNGVLLTFLYLKEKLQKKQTSVPLDRPAAPITDKENSDLTSRNGFRCKWGAPEGVPIPPFTDFSPRSVYGRIRSLSRALRPARRMGTDGACAWGLLLAYAPSPSRSVPPPP